MPTFDIAHPYLIYHNNKLRGGAKTRVCLFVHIQRVLRLYELIIYPTQKVVNKNRVRLKGERWKKERLKSILNKIKQKSIHGGGRIKKKS